MILEKYAPEENAERDTKYLFVKTFTKDNGTRYAYFVAVTIQIEGMEVNISNHRLREGQMLTELTTNKTLWCRFSNDTNASAEHQDFFNQLEQVPTNNDYGLNSQSVSVAKVPQNSDTTKSTTKKSKSDAVDDALLPMSPRLHVRNDSNFDAAKVQKEMETTKQRAQNCSLIVHTNGEPKVVYHCTDTYCTVFDIDFDCV